MLRDGRRALHRRDDRRTPRPISSARSIPTPRRLKDFLARYPKAQARQFDGDPRYVYRARRVIAYLQMLGTLVDFATFDAAGPNLQVRLAMTYEQVATITQVLALLMFVAHVRRRARLRALAQATRSASRRLRGCRSRKTRTATRKTVEPYGQQQARRGA